MRILPVLAALAVAAPTMMQEVAAQPAKPQPSTHRFRGIVEAREGDNLTIRRSSGSTLTVIMGPLTHVYIANEARLRDIKPESYISIVDVPGTQKAARVTLYSPSERGFAAGRQPWDTAPGATLTGGWIADLAGTGTRQVTLSYEGKESAFEIPAGTPITQVAPGEKALLVPGAAVTVFTNAAPDGAQDAGTIVVGRQGTVPTL